MRINEEVIELIRELANKYFGQDSKVYIFGSRIDDSKKGGDVDIYIETFVENIVNNKILFLIDLEKEIGEQKIDLIVYNPNLMEEELIHEIAKKEGIRIK
ncbi:MAG: nucleotidyltransferase domain-containing protein [bacterium]